MCARRCVSSHVRTASKQTGTVVFPTVPVFIPSMMVLSIFETRLDYERESDSPPMTAFSPPETSKSFGLAPIADRIR